MLLNFEFSVSLFEISRLVNLENVVKMLIIVVELNFRTFETKEKCLIIFITYELNYLVIELEHQQTDTD